MPFTRTSLPLSAWLLRWLPLLALCAVIVHHVWFASSHAVNIPYQDDIYDFLLFVQQVDAADTRAAAFKAWFEQYNDHRTNASRLLVYGAYLVEEEVDFRSLTQLANLALPLILLVFYFAVREDEYRWPLLLVAALLLLSLRFHTIGLSSQPSFAYFYVFLYAFACLFTLHRVTWPKFVLAAVFCTLATFTFASGQVVWLLGLASLVHQYWLGGRKAPAWSAAWLLLAIAVLAIWRIGFGDAAAQIPVASFPDQLIEPPAPLQQVLARYAAWFLVILGCAFIDSSTLWAGVAGFAMVAALSLITLGSYKRDDLRLVWCGWFVVANAAAVSVGRAMLLSPEYILQERYSFLSVLLTCILGLLLLARLHTRRAPVVGAAVLFAAVYWAWTYSHFARPLREIQSMRFSEYNAGRFWTVGMPLEESNGIVAEAIAAGIYNAPCRPFPACETAAPRP